MSQQIKGKDASTQDKEMREAYIRERKEKAKQQRLEREAKREALKAAKKAAKAAKAKEAREKQAFEQRQRFLRTTQGVEVSWDVPFANVSNSSDSGGTQTPLYLDIWRAPETTSATAPAASCPPYPPSKEISAKDSEITTNIESKRTLLPVIIWLHGGGWRYGSHHFLPKFLRPLLFGTGATPARSSRQFAIVSVGYRKSTQAPFPASVHCMHAVED